jgi:phage terminase large subunit-like protein
MYIDRVGWYWKIFPDLMKLMRDDFPEPHFVEAKASGVDLVNLLKSEGIAAVGVQVVGDKLARARMATPKAEAGLIYVRASILEKIYYDQDQGILKFPNGAKQDLADTIAQAILRHLGKTPRAFSVGWKLKPPVVREPAVNEVVSLIND